MSKALVIKGADFSINALEQITIEDNVPCTALALSISAQSVEYAGDTLAITASKTPADTTDVLTYSSSEPRIATVDNNGVVTVHGIGTATITATCGEITATVTVNQAGSIKVGNLVNVSGYYPTNTGGVGTAARLAALDGQRTIGIAFDNNPNLRIQNGATVGVEIIPIPYGANYAHLHASVEGTSTTGGKQVFYDIDNLVDVSGIEYAAYLSEGSSMSQSYKRELANHDATGLMLRHSGTEGDVFDYITFSVS